MQNATFTTQPMDNSLEPVQLEELQQRAPQPGVGRRLARHMGPRAASMINLGSGPKGGSMTNLGGSESNTGGNILMQQLHMQSKGNATWNTSGTSGNATWQSTSTSTPSAPNPFLQQMRHSSRNSAHISVGPSVGPWGAAPSGSSNANTFASIFGNAATATMGSSSNSALAMNSLMHPPQQRQLQTSDQGTPFGNNTMTFFTGMGSVTGEDDEAALRRWIDRMAEEEIG